MDMINPFIEVTKVIMRRYPAVVPLLKGRARWIADFFMMEGKTVEFFRRQIIGLIRGLYNGDILRDQFLDIMLNVIEGQLRQAYQNGVMDAGLSAEEMTDKMKQEMQNLIAGQLPYVDELAADIQNARALNQPVEPITVRADMWANRWNEAFSAGSHAVSLEFGLKEIWIVGPTEHCETCLACNGLVAFASEWDAANLHPQGANLICGGYRCKCERRPTTERRSPNVLAALMGIPKK